MDQLTATYSANRMVREYVERFYLPMKQQGELRTPETAAEILLEHQEIARNWPKLRFGAMNVSAQDGVSQTFTVEAYLDGIDEQRIAVELVAEASADGPGIVAEMSPNQPLAGSAHSYQYQCRVPSRPDGHYTPRLRVRDERLNLPLENPAVLWLK